MSDQLAPESSTRHPSWWLDEALAYDPGVEAPPLAGDLDVDVLIVGGGYTGLWTALHLKDLEPALDVAIVEQDIVGGGPSGRNGGFVNDHWEDVEIMASLFGEQRAADAAELSARAVPAIGAFLREHDIDAWWDDVPHIGVSTTPQHDGAMDDMPTRIASLGGPADQMQVLTEAQVQQVCRSDAFRGGIRYNHVAMVQPARLVRGMRRVAIERGVRLFERTIVTKFREGSPTEAVTPGGTIRAPQAVLAVNAWAKSWRRFRSAILPRASYIVLTAPAPELLEGIGWTGGESLFDFRTSLHYVRTTRDGRIAFGGASSRAGLGTGMGPRQWYDELSVRRLAEDLWRWFPSFRDVPIETAWGGPIDVSGHHLPFFGTVSGSTHYGFGFTGGGVGPSYMGGRILAGLALGREDEYTDSPLVGMKPKRFPPEPFLSLGAAMTQEAIVRTDDALDHGKRPNPILSFLARIPRMLGYNIGH